MIRQKQVLFDEVARNVQMDAYQPWYSNDDLGRDRTQVLDPTQAKLVLTADTSRFVVIQNKRGMLHLVDASTAICQPLFLNAQKVQSLFGRSVEDIFDASIKGEGSELVAWVGKLKEFDYWVVQTSEISLSLIKNSNGADIAVAPLREFGDRIAESTDAAILATANALVEFHHSHPFCSRCGSPTTAAKAGACRVCASCQSSHYPRIDIATIMLITCGNFALLGRKANWPQGRYSTLAGFVEVGETLEQCCVRETLEESGVLVDMSSVRFVASQPWPFPRSLMVGFHANAHMMEDDTLPEIVIDSKEMEDVRWFSREYVAARLDGGSTALGFQPNEQQQDFHIPGKASLARLLITRWVQEVVS